MDEIVEKRQHFSDEEVDTSEEQRRAEKRWKQETASLLSLLPPPIVIKEPAVADPFTCFAQQAVADSLFGQQVSDTPPDRERDGEALYQDKRLYARACAGAEQFRREEWVPHVRALSAWLASKDQLLPKELMHFHDAMMVQKDAPELRVAETLPAGTRCPPTSLWSGSTVGRIMGKYVCLSDSSWYWLEADAADLLLLLHNVYHMQRYVKHALHAADVAGKTFVDTWMALAGSANYRLPVAEWNAEATPFARTVRGLHSVWCKSKLLLLE
jgi:hypothetical protein